MTQNECIEKALKRGKGEENKYFKCSCYGYFLPFKRKKCKICKYWKSIVGCWYHKNYKDKNNIVKNIYPGMIFMYDKFEETCPTS